MDLMTKVNRAITKKGWSYYEFNGGDIKEICTKFSIIHEKIPLHLGINLRKWVSYPKWESVGYLPTDIKTEQSLIQYTTWEFFSGRVHNLYNFTDYGFDATQINELSQALEKVAWTNEDLARATKRRFDCVISYQQQFLELYDD